VLNRFMKIVCSVSIHYISLGPQKSLCITTRTLVSFISLGQCRKQHLSQMVLAEKIASNCLYCWFKRRMRKTSYLTRSQASSKINLVKYIVFNNKFVQQ